MQGRQGRRAHQGKPILTVQVLHVALCLLLVVGVTQSITSNTEDGHELQTKTEARLSKTYYTILQTFVAVDPKFLSNTSTADSSTKVYCMEIFARRSHIGNV